MLTGLSRHYRVTGLLGVMLLVLPLVVTDASAVADTEQDNLNGTPTSHKTREGEAIEPQGFWLDAGTDVLNAKAGEEEGPAPGATTEALDLIGATAWHDAGYTGTGVRVGVLAPGFSGYESLLGSELPDIVTAHWATSIGNPGSSPTGTLIAEIVHDIAPQADLYFANFSDSGDWDDAIDWLMTQNVAVIAAAGGWLGGPLDGTSRYSQKVAQTRSAGVLFCQAAGQLAQRHWSGPFEDLNGNEWLEYVPEVDEGNDLYATAGSSIRLALWWDDPWGGVIK
jgi:hypothetical protein